MGGQIILVGGREMLCFQIRRKEEGQEYQEDQKVNGWMMIRVAKIGYLKAIMGNPMQTFHMENQVKEEVIMEDQVEVEAAIEDIVMIEEVMEGALGHPLVDPVEGAGELPRSSAAQ